MTAALRKGWCPGALRPMAAKDGLIVRLRITGGILPAALARALADVARRRGNGLLDLSARGNLQLRGVRDDTLTPLQDDLRALGVLDDEPAAESVRNVIASPLAGLVGGPDIRPLAHALEARLVADTALHALPGKFGFLIDDGRAPTLAGIAADVRFDWTEGQFAIGLGGTRANAVWIGTSAAGDLVARAARVARGFLALKARSPDMRRMRDLIAVFGAEAVAAACEGTRVQGPEPILPLDVGAIIGAKTLDVSASTPLEPRSEIGVGSTGADEEPSRFSGHPRLAVLGLAIPFGRLDATMLYGAADLAAATPLGELRLTPWRVVLIPGAQHVAEIGGFITDPADPRLTVAACVGADGCARGSTPTHADVTTLAVALPPAAGIRLHVSGCEKGCAKPSRTAVTLVAREGRYDLVRDGRAGDPPMAHGLDLAAARQALAAALRPA